MQVQTYEIKKLFETTFLNQKNLVTPNIIRYGKSGIYLYELSKGLDMNQGELYGVTVLDTSGKHMHVLSKSFDDQVEAEYYILSLKNK